MRKVYLLFCAVIITLTSNAQFNTDWGIMLGVATHRGDINKSNSANPLGGSRANPTIGGYYRHSLKNWLSVRGQISWARISGDDANADDPARIVRNLSFRTDLIEFAGIAEFHFINIKDFGRTGRYNVFFNAYGFGGVGMTYFEPMGQNNDGQWVKLRPLQTEGEKYSTFTPAFPIGIGAHFTFNRKWRLGAELGYRFTLTDYLDDVSGDYLTWEEYENGDPLTYEMAVKIDYEYIASRPDLFPEGYLQPTQGTSAGVRGNSEVNDAYFYGTINVGFLIKGKSNFYRARYQFTRGRKHKKRRARAKF